MMQQAYKLGVKGYDISLNTHVIEAFKRLKELHSDVVAIGNPNWRCGIKLGDTIIYELGARFKKTILTRFFTPEQVNEIHQLPEERQKRWFLAEDADVLSGDEIKGVYLDEATYRAKLESFVGVTNYILIGTDYADWLIPIGRKDILARMSELAREYGFVPLSISHWASITLPALEEMDFEGHWIYLNKMEQLLSADKVHDAVKGARHPITAFRVLGGGALVSNMEDAFTYLKRLGIASIVIGAETTDQLETSIPILNNVFGTP